MPMLYLLPRRLPRLRIALTIMDLFLGAMAILLVGDRAIPTVVLHETLGCHLVQLAGLCHMVTFDILRVEIVLHNVAVPVPIFALSLHLAKVLHHVRISNLIGNGVVELSVSPFVARRDPIHSSDMDFDLPCIVAMLCILLIPGVVELLGKRVKLVGLHVFVRSLCDFQLLLLFRPRVMVDRIPIRDDVEISNSVGMYLALRAALLDTSRTFFRSIPVVYIKRQIRDDVVILLRDGEGSPTHRLARAVRLPSRVLTWCNLVKF